MPVDQRGLIGIMRALLLGGSTAGLGRLGSVQISASSLRLGTLGDDLCQTKTLPSI